MEIGHYNAAEKDSELLTRSASPTLVRNQAEFLGLALSLRVPIFSYRNSLYHSALSLSVGSGASSRVHQSLRSFQLDISLDFANGINKPWFGKTEGKVAISRMVRKRIEVDAQKQQDDETILAASVNELRILSLPNIRQNESIVKLIGIAWEERSREGRFWPESFLEFGQHGTLADYLAQGDPAHDTILEITSDILRGLCCLHENQIAHCDLKPANILIFQEVVGEAGEEQQICVAKLADFGFSVVLSDHKEKDVISQRMGTPPWSSPELTFGLPTRVSLLPKSDSFSFGLIFVYLLTKTKVRPDHLNPEWVSEIEQEPTKDQYVVGKVIQRVHDEASTLPDLRQLLFDFVPCMLNWTAEKRLRSDELLEKWLASDVFETILIPPSRQQSFSTYEFTESPYEPRETLDLAEIEDVDPSLQAVAKTESDNESDISMTAKKKLKLLPDFLKEHNFRPNALPPSGLQEAMRSMERMAESNHPDHDEASLQLAAAWTNGLLSQADISDGLNHLTRTFKLDNSQTKTVIFQVFEGLGITMPEDIEQRISQELPQLARDQIEDRYAEILFGDQIQDPVAPRMWWRKQSEACREYLGSNEFREFRGVAGIGVLILESPDFSGASNVDTDHLESYHIRKMDLFDTKKSSTLIREVKERGCLNRSLERGYTLLQHAIIRSDLALVQLLVNELQVDLENHGSTPGWTPLWLSVAMGHFEISKYLIDCGAKLDCHDTKDGFSILHLLGHFWDPQHAVQIGSRVLEAGVSAASISKSGYSTLHMAMKGWFTSRHAIADILVRHGADPTVRTNTSASALDYAIFAFDFDSLAAMADPTVFKESFKDSFAEAQLQAFEQLLVQTKFTLLSHLGPSFETSMTKAIAVLVTENMEKAMTRHDFSNGSTALSAACFLGRSHLLKPLVERAPEDINILTGKDSKQPALHWAIEMRNKSCIDILLDYGASITVLNEKGKNALHIASQHYPAVMKELIARLKLDDAGINQALEQKTGEGHSVFSTLVFEGNPLQLKLAEELRKSYSLEYDFALSDGDPGLTLTAELILFASFKGPVLMAQIRHMFKLKPAPRFVCSNYGETLLMFAVSGLRSYSHSDDLISESTLRLILEKYASESNLNAVVQSGNNKGWSVLHWAAWFPNPFALDLFQESCRTRGWTLLCNAQTLAQGSNTPLDLAEIRVRHPALLDETATDQDRRALTIRSDTAAECYAKLRSMGALLGDELKGFPVVMTVRDEFALSKVALRTVIEEVGTQFSLDHRYLDEDNPLLAQPETSGGSPAIPLRSILVFELTWLFDKFWVQGYSLHDGDPQSLLSRTRVAERAKIVGRYANDEKPWAHKNYEETLQGGRKIKWSRPGEEWLEEEVLDLAKRVNRVAKEKIPLPNRPYVRRLADRT